MAKKQVAVSLRKPPSPEEVDAFVSAAEQERERPARKGRSARRAVEQKPAVTSVVEATAPVTDQAAPPSNEASSEAPSSGVQSVETMETCEETPVSPVVSPNTPSPDAVPPSNPTPIMGSDGRLLHAVTVYLPPVLAERLAVYCIEQDRDPSNVIGEALEQHFERRLGPKTAPAAAASDDGPSTERTPPPRAESWQRGPFRGAYGFDERSRIVRLIRLGRAVVEFVRQKPWAA